MSKRVKRKRGGATFMCETCGGRTKVLRTTRTGNEIIRQRRCVMCGRLHKTREQVAA